MSIPGDGVWVWADGDGWRIVSPGMGFGLASWLGDVGAGFIPGDEYWVVSFPRGKS